MYDVPSYLEEELLYSRYAKNWLNFFGEDKTVTDRIVRILSLNKSVFNESSGFVEQMHALALQAQCRSELIIRVDDTPKKRYQDVLHNSMMLTISSDHHIVFNNQVLGGHPSEKDNNTPLSRGLHDSFHELLMQKNLYPHQQILKFLTFEKPILYKDFLEEIAQIQEQYHALFREDVGAVYNRACFHPTFIRKNYSYI